MSFNVILFKLMLFVGASSVLAAEFNKESAAAGVEVPDLQTSATSAKLLNLGSLFGGGNSGYYPNNMYRPGCSPCYGNNALGCYCSGVGKYPATNYPSGSYYPSRNYYPNNNFYPSNYYPTSMAGTNILGGGYGGYGGYSGYGGYGGYGGNGGLRQYYGYYDPNYAGRRNLGYAYYTNTNTYGLPTATNDRYGTRERNRASYTFRGYD